jgi:quercetin dioxygenase-like cupin family protein/DNA-binding XRE family transcriptional regulator
LLSDVLRQELTRYAVGAKIRALRWQRGLRLVEMSQKTGLSSALLSKIERGQSVPTIPALFKIATCLEVGLAHFFPRPRRSPAVISRSAERIRLPETPDAKDSSYDFECLNYAATTPRIQCYAAEFRSGQGGRYHAHPGGEFIFVMSGGLRLTIESEEYVLESGDSVYFDSAVPHNYAKVGDGPSTALVVTLPAAVSIAEADIKTTGDALRLRGKEIIWRRVS